MEAEAIHNFTPTDSGELAFQRGDKLLLLNYGDPIQWYQARKDGQTGIVPGNYIKVLKASWYYGRITRSSAESLLMGYEQDGNFLIRLSESSPNDFSLSVKCGDSVQHFRILRDADFKYFLWQTRFDSLNQLVENYKNESVSRTQKIFLRDRDEDSFIVKAKYDFEPNPDIEEGESELGFSKDDIIHVFDARDDNWWGGRIGDRSGFFPKLYVERLTQPTE